MEWVSVRIFVPTFWSIFDSKNIYQINENTNFPLQKTWHQDHNLLRWSAVDWTHPGTLLMAQDTLMHLLQSLDFLIKISIESHIDFWIFGNFCSCKILLDIFKFQNINSMIVASTAAILPAPINYRALQQHSQII